MNTDITSTISVEDAWELFSTSDEMRLKFTKHVTEAKLDYTTPINPYWALWFARFIIGDEWLMGESLMNKDTKVWSWYNTYTEIMRECGALGWSTKISAKYKLNDRGQIISDLRADLPQIVPIGMKQERKREERQNARETADRISKQMEDFQKQRKRTAHANDD